MPTYDFDFQRYVERRKGVRAAEQREGATYAYSGDLRIRKLLARARPVTLALEATVRLWRATARAELLATARRANEAEHPRVVRAAAVAAERLHVAAPPVLLSPHPDVVVRTFGTDDDPQLLVHAGLETALDEAELLHAIGAALGRIQNGHVLLLTARHLLGQAERAFLRFVVRPATLSLDAWAARGQVTADRAGLLATRDLAASLRALDRLGRDQPPGTPTPGGAPDEQARADPDVGDLADPSDDGGAVTTERRKAALAVFARSAYFRGALGEAGGLDPGSCDAETARALRGKA